MQRAALIAALLAICAAPLAAQGLFDSLREGATNIGEAIGQGAQSAGEAIGRGADFAEDEAVKIGDAVSEEMVDTAALFDGSATPDDMRAQLDAMAEKALAQLAQEQPNASAQIDTSVGYAVFDTRKVSLMGFAGGAGRGVAVDTRKDSRSYMKMATGGVGFDFGFGGFDSQVVILFETFDAYDSFITLGLDATAQGAAHLGQEGRDQLARFSDGRAVYVLTKDGWRVSASLAGTKYWPDDNLNAAATQPGN